MPIQVSWLEVPRSLKRTQQHKCKRLNNASAFLPFLKLVIGRYSLFTSNSKKVRVIVLPPTTVLQQDKLPRKSRFCPAIADFQVNRGPRMSSGGRWRMARSVPADALVRFRYTDGPDPT